MFERFLATYKTDRQPEQPEGAVPDVGAIGFREFFDRFAGCTFNDNRYRVHSAGNVGRWTEMVTEVFPEYSGRAVCFGCDWLGGQFALDSERQKDGDPMVLIFEPGTGEVLQIPATFREFHESELVDHADSALAEAFYVQWLAAGHQPPEPKECVGYRVPLFLGGDDEINNLELVDMEVYWHLTGQLITQTRDLPPGTPVSIRGPQAS